MISPHRISQEHCIGTSLRKSSNFERNRFLRSCTLRWLAFANQRQGRGGSSVVGRGNCPAELTNQLAQPSSHRPATTSAEQPCPLAASTSPALLPAHRQCRAMAGSRPTGHRPAVCPAQPTNQPAKPSAHKLADSRQRSPACQPHPLAASPGPAQAAGPPASRPAQPTNKPSSLTAASAAPLEGCPPWPSPALPPALAQPGPPSSAAEAKYK